MDKDVRTICHTKKKMSEMSETEKINSVLFLLYVESKNKNKSELMDIENRLVVA